jgi:hypothetical protein
MLMAELQVRMLVKAAFPLRRAVPLPMSSLLVGVEGRWVARRVPPEPGMLQAVQEKVIPTEVAEEEVAQLLLW